jgi:hypothetical protein
VYRSHRRGSTRCRGGFLSACVVALVLGLAALGPVPPAAAVSPSDVLPAMTRTLGGTLLPGTFAVVVARQHAPARWMSVRAAEAETQRVAAAVAGNGSAARRPFPTASLVKLFVAEHLLHGERAGRIALDARDVRLMARMIRSSDDAAASELWVRFDGPGIVRDVARRYGMERTAPPVAAGQWGRTTTTAEDVARFLSLMPVQAHPADAERLHRWMRDATPIATDGFDQRFGLFGAADERLAVKHGWMCCVGDRRHLHSVGVLGGTVVVLLTEVRTSVGYAEVKRALTAAAAEVPPPRRS